MESWKYIQKVNELQQQIFGNSFIAPLGQYSATHAVLDKIGVDTKREEMIMAEINIAGKLSKNTDFETRYAKLVVELNSITSD